MADLIWKEKGNNLPSWDEVRIINREERWIIRCLKEAVHMLGFSDLLRRPSKELYTIWESIIKRFDNKTKKNIAI